MHTEAWSGPMGNETSTASPRSPSSKRRRTLYALPHLMAYKREDEDMGAIRIGMDPRSRDLLKRLSIDVDVTESTWFSYFGDRLLREPNLKRYIGNFVRKHGSRFPPTGGGVFRNYTIPVALREAIDVAAQQTFPAAKSDARGVTGPWLRLALVYLAYLERGWKP